MIDRYRAAVYRAEDQWSASLDRGGPVDFFGSRIDIPVQLRFGRIEEVRTYVECVCSDIDVEPANVRHRKGGTRAHYSHGVIAIPGDEPWAMRESVVLHEVAHHVCVITEANASHDSRFTAVMLTLARIRLGHEAELLLRTGYAAAGVPMDGAR